MTALVACGLDRELVEGLPASTSPGGGLRDMVDVHPIRERFVNLTCVVGEVPLAEAVARAVGFHQHRDGEPTTPENAINGVLVALGLGEDRFGGRRTRMRRYRALQFEAALEGIAQGYRLAVA